MHAGHRGLHATLQTLSVWPSSTRRQRPDSTSQSRTVLSRPRRARCRPSRTPRHAQDAVGVAFEHAQAAARLHVPQPHGLVHCPGERAAGRRDSTPRSRRCRCGLRARAGTGPTRRPTAARSCPRPRRAPAGHRGLHATLQTLAVWPSSTRRQRPLTRPPTAARSCPRPRRAPAGRRDSTPRSRRCRCGLRARAGTGPLSTSHSRTVLSLGPGERLPAVGTPRHAPDAVGVAFEHAQAPAAGSTSHSRTVLSSAPESACRPSGLHATLLTLAVWPSSTRRQRPLARRPTAARSCHPTRRAPAGRRDSTPRSRRCRCGLRARAGTGRGSTSHSRTVLSHDPESACRPSGLHATLKTLSVWPSSTRRHRPLATSHSRTVLSAAPESACRPSGLQATLQTLSVWPSSTRRHRPLARRPTAARSCPTTRRAPAGHPDSTPRSRRGRCGLRARAGTGRWPPPTAAPSCPTTRRAPAGHPDSRPRSRRCRCGLRARAGTGRWPPPTAARSCLPPRRAPAGRRGLHATLLTLSVWPSSTRRHRPLATSHSRTVLSHDPESACRPSGLQATLQTLAVWPSESRVAWSRSWASVSWGAGAGGRQASRSFA